MEPVLRSRWRSRSSAIAALALVMIACGSDGGGESEPTEPPPTPSPTLSSFQIVDDQTWNETAVRKVLQVFAFGGFASDAQIRTWADMPPRDAITEMITFRGTNERLSPRGDASPKFASLAALADHWSSSQSAVPADDRADYAKQEWSSPARVWGLAVSRTGLNPVRHRIGLFETNYHLAVNQDAGVNNWQMFRYYDDVMSALEQDVPYQGVLAVAAQSAAVAQQYNHKRNRFEDARFRGNEDFGRELHQLFFGILGVDDPEYHELTSVRNTSKALTDMPVERVGEGDAAHDADVVTFGTEFHYPGALEVLGQSVDGTTAKEKIAGICAHAIAHRESLENLPVIIVRTLADDQLTPEKTATIRAAWAEMEPKSLLTFLRNYATSTTFHDVSRIKYWTSIERNLRNANSMTLSGEEAYAKYYDPAYQIQREGVRVFRPTRNVFGSQTGHDAIASGAVFREAYNQSVERYWTYARTDDDERPSWTKDWSKAIPPEGDGTWRVRGVAEWLWQRFIADGLANFGPLERAHTYALLGAGVDFALFVDDQAPQVVYTLEDLETRGDLKELVADMEIAVIGLQHEDADERETANRRIGMAVNFIVATPYAFVQEGR